ncbi:MAG: glycosyltransferase family 39 protein [Clostridia bacterium]|nr:glycosyltransferase family 39 protein [Clostridia bacterium]
MLIFYAIACFALWSYYLAPALAKGRRGEENAVYIIALTALSAAVHIVCAVKYRGHNTDMGCFTGWADMIYQNGFGNFYSSDAFTDYPPGYMYVLYIIGAVKHLFNPQEGGLWLLVKLPAIICDILTGILIYKIAKKKLGDGVSAAVAAAYLFNPAVILNSSLWGQVDSVYTLFTVLMVYLVSQRQMIKAYFVFAICIFIKPQAFMFMPIIIFGIIENVFLPKFDSKAFARNLAGGLCAVAAVFALSVPFGIGNVIKQYTETLSSYPYMTVNAFNVWGALGKNWTELSPFMSAANYVILAAAAVYSAYVFFRTKSEARYYIAAAVLSFVTFMLSVKMHDRYAFPTMAMLLLAFVYISTAKGFWIYVLSALTQFFNTAWVLFIYEQDINKYFKSPVIVAASIVNIAFLALFLGFVQKGINEAPVAEKEEKKNSANAEKSAKTMRFKRSEQLGRLDKFDFAAMAVLMTVYGAIAFYHLGDTHAPQTFVDIGSNNSVEIDLGSEKTVSKMKLYLGSYQLAEDRLLNIEYCDENGTQVSSSSINSGAVFYWSDIEAGERVRYIRLSTNNKNLSIMELGIIDENGSVITPSNAQSAELAPMFDEQRYIPERTTYMNSTYFDEIYHARTGYEFVHGLEVYEWTHPPLGKDFIALGIKMFGMTPFGWRFMGTLFGVLMIPVIYVFARRLLKCRWAAVLTAVIFTFDFMHFAQTRIATIDVYVTFFIMLMYYYMYKYFTMSFYDTPLKKTLVPLALSGIFMGLGIASKWTGIYAGVGLAIIFFISLYKRYSEYLYAKKTPNGETDGISHKHVIESFVPNFRVTAVWCCIFFVFVPLLIYGLSYIPYLRAPSAQGIKTIIENQSAIYAYHSKTVVESTHPFSSKWYEWIVMTRPIWYYSGEISETVKEGISSFGNPLVWWVGIPALFLMIYRMIFSRDKKALFLVIGYVIQILFWIPVTRTTFIYHYFPCVPFLVLMIGCCMVNLYSDASDGMIFAGKKIGVTHKQGVIILCCLYAAAVVGMFIMFYPVLSGAPCTVDYAKHLKWFDTWVLLAS